MIGTQFVDLVSVRLGMETKSPRLLLSSYQFFVSMVDRLTSNSKSVLKLRQSSFEVNSSFEIDRFRKSKYKLLFLTLKT